jgi:hypothetical protein
MVPMSNLDSVDHPIQAGPLGESGSSKKVQTIKRVMKEKSRKKLF